MNGYKKMFHKIMGFKLNGADTYYNNGSTWIILTDKKQWVIELTKDGTLWYNFYFFQSILTGLMGFEDTVKNQNYITEWVENFIQNGVNLTLHETIPDSFLIEDTIQNGVTNTQPNLLMSELTIEETIQNGVKETTPGGYLGSVEMKGKMVHQFESPKQNNEVEDVIESGIKETKYCELHSLMRADHIIRDGIKETWGYEKQPQIRVTEVINEGIKETNWRKVDNHPTYLDNIINSNKLGLSDGQS